MSTHRWRIKLTNKHIKFMKTNMIQAIATTIIIGLIAAFGSTNITGDYLTSAAVGVSYLAVTVLVALTVADYRGRQRHYSA